MNEEVKNNRSEDSNDKVAEIAQFDLNEDIPDFSAKSRKIK